MSEQPPSVTLLYVEDEQLTAEAVGQDLRDAGFEIVSALNAKQAYAALEAHGETIQGVTTDINLGKGPDGWAIGKRARQTCPTMPIVYVSGASQAEWASMGVPNSVMISKPFASMQLTVAISSLLNATPAISSASE